MRAAVDLLTGSLVDLLVADSVRRTFFELIEVDGLIRRGRVEADRNGHQTEGKRPRPDGACHGHIFTQLTPESTRVLHPFARLAG